jgi:Domain of unknown function (DUF1330)
LAPRWPNCAWPLLVAPYLLWQFDTTTDNLLGNPRVNSGGVWEPSSVDEAGNLYFGTGNPGPFPGSTSAFGDFPNGSSRPGDNAYTCSMISLDGQTGALRWSITARPHDLFDLDFQATPILTTALRHRAEVVEGDFGPYLGPTIVAFPTFAQLRAWYDSKEYAPLKSLRQQHMRFDVLLVDGLSDEEIAENLQQVGVSWTAARADPASSPPS